MSKNPEKGKAEVVVREEKGERDLLSQILERGPSRAQRQPDRASQGPDRLVRLSGDERRDGGVQGPRASINARVAAIDRLLSAAS
jgi:hypothetical protein